MRDACIRAVSRAMGRDLTEAEERNIETRIRGVMQREARRAPGQWRAMTGEQRMIEAGKIAARELVEEARKKTERVQLQTAAHQRIHTYARQQVAEGRDKTVTEALMRTLVQRHDMAGGDFMSVESRANAIFDDALRQLGEVFDAASPGLWRRIQDGMVSLKPLQREFINALHGLKGVDPALAAAAAKYHEIAEALRTQFNAAGGVVGRLESWGAPHTWSARLVAKAGQDKFAADMMEWIDPRAYVHEDGTPYTRVELWEMLREAWKALASDGVVTLADNTGPLGQPNLPGVAPPLMAVKANRHRHHRVIHLKPENAADALEAYSELNILEALTARTRAMSRDVALVETYGPNADNEFRKQLDEAIAEDALMDPPSGPKLQGKGRYLTNLYDYVAGNDPPPRSRALTEAFDTLAAVQVASKLGGATLSSITDFAPLYQTALLHHLKPWQVMMNSTLAWAPRSRRFVRRMGLMLDTVQGAAERYSGENLTGARISRQVASAVIRVSGLGFVTNARRIGFSMTLMDAIGHLTRQAAYADVTRLQESDHRILASKGVTQQVWDVWRAASLDNWGVNHTLLTPDAIMAVEGVSPELRREAVIKLLSIVREEQDLAVIAPGAREIVQMRLGTERGTVQGEIARSAMMFKSFPWTVMQRHMERGKAMDSVFGRFAYMGALTVNMTLLGVLALWTKDLAAGKDPRSMNVLTDDEDERSIGMRNWMHALLQGGAFGIYGDYLFQENSPRSGATVAETFLGPNVSSAAQVIGLTHGNAIQASLGEETDMGAESVRFARSHIPFANLWYTRALTDRAIFNTLTETVDPGYLSKLQARQERTAGTTYWWPLDEVAPARPPEAAAPN